MSRKDRARELARRRQEQSVTARTLAVAKTEATFYSGPLPPAESLIKYNEAFPGCAERIVAMAERQQEHRQSLESSVINGNAAAQLRGQILAGAICLACVGCGTFLIYIGKDPQGLAAIITPLGGLVGVFVYGRWKQGVERKEKRDELEKPRHR